MIRLVWKLLNDQMTPIINFELDITFVGTILLPFESIIFLEELPRLVAMIASKNKRYFGFHFQVGYKPFSYDCRS